MLCVRYWLSVHNVEDLSAKRGIDISHETLRIGGTVSSVKGSKPKYELAWTSV